jgi:hypothetical protein
VTREIIILIILKSAIKAVAFLAIRKPDRNTQGFLETQIQIDVDLAGRAV